MKVAITVDVESDCGLGTGFRGVECINNLVDLLNKNGVKGTFFVTGKVMEAYPNIIDKLVGHEIGSHCYRHIELTKTKNISELLQKSYDVMRDNGLKRIGFRAPRFKVNNKVLNEVAKYFKYDSSVISNKKIKLHNIKELPVSKVYCMPFGLTYFIVNKGIMNFALKTAKLPETTIFYCHSTDFVKIKEKPNFWKNVIYYSKCKPKNIEILNEIIKYFKKENAKFITCKEI